MADDRPWIHEPVHPKRAPAVLHVRVTITLNTALPASDLAKLPTIEALDLLDEAARAAWVPAPADPALPYGPNTGAVRAIIEKLPSVDREGMARAEYVAGQLGARRFVGGLRDALGLAAVAAAAERSGRRAEFLAAFWDAGREGVWRWGDPIFLKFFWNNRFEGGITEAAQYAAAATVVADLVDENVLRPILAPWRAATGEA